VRDGRRDQSVIIGSPEAPLFDYTAIAALDGVKFEVDEARSWFARTPRSFDVIQMSLIDTWRRPGRAPSRSRTRSLHGRGIGNAFSIGSTQAACSR